MAGHAGWRGLRHTCHLETASPGDRPSAACQPTTPVLASNRGAARRGRRAGPLLRVSCETCVLLVDSATPDASKRSCHDGGPPLHVRFDGWLDLPHLARLIVEARSAPPQSVGSDTLTGMSIDSDAVLREALALPVDRRAEVAAQLLASLDEPVQDDPDDIRRGWAEELERRARRAISGEDPGQPWPEVRDRIRNKLAR